jgi:XRE family aerobic/anaerobic benzoate catabolism transcriptional regulator
MLPLSRLGAHSPALDMASKRVSKTPASSAKRRTAAPDRAAAQRNGTHPEPVAPVVRSAPAGGVKHPYLIALGERVRLLRSRRGMTRKALAAATGVSERHLGNLEYGVGNASVLVLLQVAQALDCALAELLGDATTLSPEWLLLREQLEPCSEAELRRVRLAVGELLGPAGAAGEGAPAPSARIALIGLRGAGKSTLGARLALDLGFPFIELSRAIEKIAGCPISEIQALYGQNAYRRYERRALEEAVQRHAEVVIATPGGVVADPATFHLLLSSCTTVWLQASPEDHMKRVLAQGDTRPMAASREAMADLKAILAGRSAFYSKADLQVDTSAQPCEASFALLREQVRGLLQR